MKSLIRKLQKKPLSIEERAIRYVTLSGLKPRVMVRGANQNLIDWLNQGRSVSVRRVLEIIDLAQQAQRIADEARQAAADEQYFSAKFRAGTILSKLNAALSRYNCTAIILFWDASLHRRYLFSARGRKDRPEVIAVAFLIENLAFVHRVRRCVECQRWFFGITEHQKYCGDNCRKRHAAHGQSFKEQRRLYMREYRSKEKARDANAKKLARGK